jgi:hypothetical protein
VEAGANGEEGLAGAGWAVAGDEGDGGIEKGIEQTLLAEIDGAEIDAAGDMEGIGDEKALEAALGEETGGHCLALAGTEEDVFIDHNAGEAGIGDSELAGAGKALELVGMDLDAAEVVALDVAGLDLVIEIILAAQADGEGFEVHVEVFGDEDGGNLLGLLDEEDIGKDAVIDAIGIREDVAETGEGGVGFFGLIEDGEADGAAAIGADALGDGFAILA